MTVTTLPESDDDLLDCATWYEDRREGLGDDFEACLDEAFEKLLRYPRVFGVVYSEPLTSSDKTQIEQLRELIGDIDAGRVKMLVILGGNPVSSLDRT